MGKSYEGSLSEWLDLNSWHTKTVDELLALAQAQGKPYDRVQIRRQRHVNKLRVSGAAGYLPRTRGPGAAADARLSAALAKPGKRRAKGPTATTPENIARVAAGLAPRIGRPPKLASEAEVVGVVPKRARPPAQTKAEKLAIREAALAEVAEVAERGNGYSLAERKAAIMAAEVHEDGPPPKHSAFRRLILDIGLDVASEIFDEFKLISERMR